MKRVLGVGLLLAGAAAIAYGAHTVISNGNCSSTGFTQYGPVPKCSHGSEFLGITGLFFLGPVILIAGGLWLGVKGVTWPAMLAGIGVGALIVHSDSGVSQSAKSAGAGVAGVCAVLIVVSVMFTVRRLLRHGSVTSQGDGSALRAPTVAVRTPAPGRAGAPGAPAVKSAADGDAISKIARLAQLRDDGALTTGEFDRQKARLLDEV
jgi:hypothetical protein